MRLYVYTDTIMRIHRNKARYLRTVVDDRVSGIVVVVVVVVVTIFVQRNLYPCRNPCAKTSGKVFHSDDAHNITTVGYALCVLYTHKAANECA